MKYEIAKLAADDSSQCCMCSCEIDYGSDVALSRGDGPVSEILCLPCALKSKRYGDLVSDGRVVPSRSRTLKPPAPTCHVCGRADCTSLDPSSPHSARFEPVVESSGDRLTPISGHPVTEPARGMGPG